MYVMNDEIWVGRTKQNSNKDHKNKPTCMDSL